MLRFGFGMIERFGGIRFLKDDSEIVQPPRHQRDAEQRAELDLAGMFKSLARALRHAHQFGKFLLGDVLAETRITSPFGARMHHILRHDHHVKNIIGHDSGSKASSHRPFC